MRWRDGAKDAKQDTGARGGNDRQEQRDRNDRNKDTITKRHKETEVEC